MFPDRVGQLVAQSQHYCQVSGRPLIQVQTTNLKIWNGETDHFYTDNTIAHVRKLWIADSDC